MEIVCFYIPFGQDGVLELIAGKVDAGGEGLIALEGSFWVDDDFFNSHSLARSFGHIFDED